jgi:hypothetical protein
VGKTRHWGNCRKMLGTPFVHPQLDRKHATIAVSGGEHGIYVDTQLRFEFF